MKLKVVCDRFVQFKPACTQVFNYSLNTEEIGVILWVVVVREWVLLFIFPISKRLFDTFCLSDDWGRLVKPLLKCRCQQLPLNPRHDTHLSRT